VSRNDVVAYRNRCRKTSGIIAPVRQTLRTTGRNMDVHIESSANIDCTSLHMSLSRPEHISRRSKGSGAREDQGKESHQRRGLHEKNVEFKKGRWGFGA
jgi:hypothetical protein